MPERSNRGTEPSCERAPAAMNARAIVGMKSRSNMDIRILEIPFFNGSFFLTSRSLLPGAMIRPLEGGQL